jgi:phage-related protein
MTQVYFEYNGIKSIDKGLLIKKGRHIDSPDRDATFQSIPGRNGDLIIDNRRFTNYEDEYDCWMKPLSGQTIYDQARDIKNWLKGSYTYKKLIDSPEPNYYREAVCITKLDIEKMLLRFGAVKAVFNCKPFRRRVDGDTIQSLVASGTVTNPERWESEPYIKITGSGDITLKINDQDIILTGVSDYLEIDSELQSCFKGLVLQNSHYRSDFWPVLNIGENQISWTGSVTKVEIKPRWRTL